MAEQMRILLVEDNDADEYLTRRAVADADATAGVEAVRSTEEAAHLLAQRDFDVILLDLGLPGSHGVTTIRRMRRQAPDVPIVVLTGLALAGVEEEALAAEADDFVAKSALEAASIGRAIQRAISVRRSRSAGGDGGIERDPPPEELAAEETTLAAPVASALAPGRLSVRVLVAAGLAAAAVFAFDWSTELGIAGAVPYFAVVWITSFARRPSWVWSAAAVCSGLTVVGALSSPAGGALLQVASNRAVALSAIWITAALTVRQLRTLAELAETHLLSSKLAAIVESSLDAIIGLTLDGIVTSWNRGAEALYGYSADEIVGRHVRVLVPDERRTELDGILSSLDRGETVEHFDTVRLRSDGTRQDVSLMVSPVRDTSGRVVGSSSIARDITRRKRLEKLEREHLEELADVNEALERSNVQLQQFAYVASHDLQAPLRSIAGFAQFLQSDYRERLDEQGEHYLDHVIRGALRMKSLINDILSYSRVESTASPFAPTDLGAVLEDAMDALRLAIEESGAVIEREALPTVTGDRAQLTQLLQNLLSNAIKYRGDAPLRIVVRASEDPLETVVSVRDNGIGIGSSHHERIFEIFRRLHTESEHPGTGIGLAICARIVDRHRGRIWVESEPGLGSTFHFTLPGREARFQTDRMRAS